MDGQHSFKRTEETEIDLADLMRKLCRKWRQILVCALAAAVIFGCFGWLKGRDTADKMVSEANEEELTEAEEQAVTEAVRLEKEIRALDEYLENSVLMQLDPYHKHRFIMLYGIDRVKRQELAAVTESYLNFISNGGAADVLSGLSGRWNMDKSYLEEMISAYQRTYNAPYQIAVDALSDSGMLSEALFYVEITGTDGKEAETMAVDIQQILKDYSADVKKTAGSHRLKLLNCTEGTAVDLSLWTQQHDKRAQLSANHANLKAAVDTFSERQKSVYEKAVNIKGSREEDTDDSQEYRSGETASGRDYKALLKYALIGIFAGGLFYAGIFTCRYLFSDEVKNTEELKRMYTFPVYGQIQFCRKKKSSRRVLREHRDSYGNTQEQVINRVRISCQKQGIARLCAVSDFQLAAAEREFLEKTSARLASCGITMTVTENAGKDTDAWDSLIEAGNFLLLCRIETTTYQSIDDAVNLYLENGMTAAGAVAFLTDTEKPDLFVRV